MVCLVGFLFYFCGESWFHFAVEELAVWNVLCLLFFFFLAAICSMWSLSFLTGIGPPPPAVEVQGLKHWPAREVPLNCIMQMVLFEGLYLLGR